jgi:putative lipoprotein
MRPVFSLALIALSLSLSLSPAAFARKPRPPPVADTDVKAQGTTAAGVPELVANPDAKPSAVMPDASGTERKGPPSLTNTYWRLVDIEGTPVPLRAQFRESHLRLLAGTDRFLGQGICNRIGGGYTLAKRKLSIDVIDKMPSPCWPDGPPESALIDALTDTVSFEIKGRDLYLLDSDGVRRAHYNAAERVSARVKAIQPEAGTGP